MIRHLHLSLPPGRTDDAVVVDVGDVLCIELRSRLGTGYGWSATVSDHTRLQDVPCPHATVSDVEPGAEEPQRFCFAIAREGKATVHLAYRRPWQPDAPLHRVAVLVSAR